MLLLDSSPQTVLAKRNSALSTPVAFFRTSSLNCYFSFTLAHQTGGFWIVGVDPVNRMSNLATALTSNELL